MKRRVLVLLRLNRGWACVWRAFRQPVEQLLGVDTFDLLNPWH